MRFASAVSTDPDLEAAISEVAERVSAGLGGAAPDLSFLFVSAHHADRLEDAPGLLAERIRPGLLLGCSAGGVIGGGDEVEENPGVSLTSAVLPGVEAVPFHLGPGDSSEDAPAAEAGYVLLADPFSFPAEEFLAGLDRRAPRATKIGGLASGGTGPGGHRLYLGDGVFADGVVGVALSGKIAVEAVVAQGCRPVGEPMFVTRANRNILFEVDERPVLEILHAIFEASDERDRALFRHALHLGVGADESAEEYRHGDFLIRNIVGIDRTSGALAVGALLHERQVVQFHLRDAKTAAEDLRMLLSRYAMESRGKPAGGLLFSCLGRGIHLFGRPNHDTGIFRDRLGDVPLGGFFCNGEIGPVRGVTHVHGFTSSFGLFRPSG